MSEGKPGRNDKCPCGSGRKYKHCCLEKDEEAARQARAEAAAAAAAEAATATAAQDAAAQSEPPRHPPANDQPWRRGSDINTHGFRAPSAPRKVGSG